MIKRFIAGMTLAFGAVLAASLPLPAAAQPFPSKSIKIIVPYTPGARPISSLAWSARSSRSASGSRSWSRTSRAPTA